MFLQIWQVQGMSSPVAARSPRTQAAANALVLFDPAHANPARAKKRSPLEAAEEKVRKVTLSTTKLKEELDVLLRKGVPKDVRATNALRNKKIKFLKSRDVLLPAAEAKLTEAKQKALDAKALLWTPRRQWRRRRRTSRRPSLITLWPCLAACRGAHIVQVAGQDGQHLGQEPGRVAAYRQGAPSSHCRAGGPG